MLRRPRLLLALGATLIPTLAASELEQLEDYRLGLDALAGRLWEVAEARFTSALETPDLQPATRQRLLLRLAEARIRGGRAPLALPLLDEPVLAEHPERPFWTAQALAGSGRLAEAARLIEAEALDPEAPFRREAMLTRARLLRAIGDLDGSLAALDQLLEVAPDSDRARQLRASILLDRNQPLAALTALEEAGEGPQSELLRARARLATGDFESAAEGFAALVASPEGQTLDNYHAATLGLARARLALGDASAAADGLIAFIQQNPTSPRLDEAFGLLLECLPEQAPPNDPILTRLRAWIPPPQRPAPGPVRRRDGINGAWPREPTEADPLAPEAMFHLALGLRRNPSPDTELDARRLLTRLRLEYPRHPLVPRALLEAGRWHLENDRRDRAAAHFDAITRLGGESNADLRAQALTLEGSARFQSGDFEQAAAVFDQAASLLEGDQREAALLNAATALLADGDLAAFDQLANTPRTPALSAQLELERALFLTSQRDPDALPALREFLRRHPEHPRLDEARLHAALAALDSMPPDLEFAAAQLARIEDAARATLPAATLALAEMRLAEARGDWAAAAARAARFLDANPDHPRRNLFRYEHGRALFHNQDYNAARIELQTLAREAPEAPQTPAALLLSARAAAEGATPQSQAESLELFDRLIAEESPFADVARLEKADILIRLSRLDEAISVLEPWFDSMQSDSPLLLSVGLLLGDAIFAQAQGDPIVLQRALDVYDRLLEALPEDDPNRPRVVYHKGLTLERFGDREDEALVAYMDVIQRIGDQPRGDWKAIELCGFSALRLLEQRENWPAAKRLAERIAALEGPRAEEAAGRARELGINHMIWDEGESE